MARKTGNVIGGWAFLLGLVLALIIALFGITNQSLIYTLVIIGLIVGLLNVGDEETEPFLLSGVVLIIASSLGGSSVVGIPYIGDLFRALLLVFVPATIIVAIKNVFSLAKR